MYNRILIVSLFFLGLISAQTSTPSSYTLAPQTVSAGTSFNLALKNPKFSCATVFSNQTVNASGNIINLGFKATQDSVKPCPKSDSLFGPVFSIPALNAGSDSVFAMQQPACAPLCALPLIREFAGILTVLKPVGDSGWFIQPRQTAAEKPFTLQLLSYSYGNCQTSFTHDSLVVQNNTLYASFVIENHPERACVADIRPYGPSYDVQGLKPGKYPVYAVQHLACEYTNPRCLVAIQPVLVDTLSVVRPTPLLAKPVRVLTLTPADQLGIEQGFRLDGRKAVLRR